MNLEEILKGMTSAQIAQLVADIQQQGNVKSVDHTRKLRRIARNNLYFSSAPKPHQVDSFYTYTQHADSIREQVLSGVE